MDKKKKVIELKHDVADVNGGGIFDRDDDIYTYMICHKCGYRIKWQGNRLGQKFPCPNPGCTGYIIGEEEEE